ncbi:hypothetical protein [Butyrivibrio proteoclasticus]|uniref:hypothetical protein n=1 Tax=Butyrivibrio proteoclasticus TaxID=43305 RepID=UPI0004794E9D|nr:hypothetical protein [Butyrivibrio proteoclasticus]
MRRRLVSLLMACVMVSVTGCAGDVKGDGEAASSGSSEIAPATEDSVAGDGDSSFDSTEESAAEESSVGVEDDKVVGVEGGYDCTYLVEADGVYAYRLTDEELIAEYNELYAAAFEETIASLEDVKSWMDQSYSGDAGVVTSDLVSRDYGKEEFVKTGSFYEMDFDMDLENVGFSYVDLNSDGIFELVFGVLRNVDDEWGPWNCVERAYTLIDGEAVKFYEGGSRMLFWLGNDGAIYQDMSGGAAYGGTSRMHFDPSTFSVDEDPWGGLGLVQDEFVGYWEGPVHVVGPIEDMDEAAKLPENQITDDELGALMDEWSERMVEIEWLKFTEYFGDK